MTSEAVSDHHVGAKCFGYRLFVALFEDKIKVETTEVEQGHRGCDNLSHRSLTLEATGAGHLNSG